MGTQYSPPDPVERDLAAAQLDDIAVAYEGKPWAVWKDVVLCWHIEAIANARAEAWIPGMAGPQDPVVEEALGRFYRHHMRLTISQLRAENLDLRRSLVDAVASARFYASGATDNGERARTVVAAHEPHATDTVAHAGRSH